MVIPIQKCNLFTYMWYTVKFIEIYQLLPQHLPQLLNLQQISLMTLIKFLSVRAVLNQITYLNCKL